MNQFPRQDVPPKQDAPPKQDVLRYKLPEAEEIIRRLLQATPDGVDQWPLTLNFYAPFVNDLGDAGDALTAFIVYRLLSRWIQFADKPKSAPIKSALAQEFYEEDDGEVRVFSEQKFLEALINALFINENGEESEDVDAYLETQSFLKKGLELRSKTIKVVPADHQQPIAA